MISDTISSFFFASLSIDEKIEKEKLHANPHTERQVRKCKNGSHTDLCRSRSSMCARERRESEFFIPSHFTLNERVVREENVNIHDQASSVFMRMR